MNVLDKRESNMLSRYKDKLQNVNVQKLSNSIEYSNVIVILCDKLFLSSAILNWHKNCVWAYVWAVHGWRLPAASMMSLVNIGLRNWDP